ncbi:MULTISPECIES: 2OG-Fe(II) oxygenase [Pseudoalteromonas]|uniref:2OG-Fe(II) oxygenase n=1 Tax=Pseudoalteromonas obscura TaxID=3048491 RepID=A0ABT7EKD1_9GAMM|nr:MULTISPECIES: 2OG-Fe(II) oxygenase [Pseudoalteromonas]MBQ4837305.1 2OG-Fe(II) oxygenase [Pseudoalteromonas luteoviolacea]MDK2595472.1 2OG-Fe(II) oxygenase [Pseudoalteromonas sp. P94(2023)]
MSDFDTENVYEQIANDLRATGLSIIENAIDPSIIQALNERIASLEADTFQTAGIGRQNDHEKNAEIRRDKIRWLDKNSQQEAGYLNAMDDLKDYLNRRLFMGLFSYESHFAHYEAGAFYKKHLDAFKGKANRVLTTVFYLNDDWQPQDGGELVIFDAEDHEKEHCRVLPKKGTLVTFLSDEFPHEVLAAKKSRYSIAGWFRINASTAGHIDPPR